MFKYLCFQRAKPRTSGSTRCVTPIIKTKNRKYGYVIDTECVTKLTPTLITGAHDAGKSRMLERLYREEREIWGAKIHSPALWLGALRPLAAWIEAGPVGEWWDQRAADHAVKIAAGKPAPPAAEMIPWKHHKPWQKAELLADYVRDTGAVLFLDDCHRLTGRKLQIARSCAMAAKIWIASASDEARIAPNLRSVLMRRDPQIIRLGSDVAYDATGALTWMLAILLLIAGAGEAALVVAGLRMLSSGRLAAKQDA